MRTERASHAGPPVVPPPPPATSSRRLIVRILLGILAVLLLGVAGLYLSGTRLTGHLHLGWKGPVTDELTRLYLEDQRDHAPGRVALPAAEAKAVLERDRRRRLRADEMLAAGQLRKPEDYFHAAMIFAHGETPADFLRAHDLAVVAGFREHEQARLLSAVAMDSFLLSIGRPQHYGTQVRRLPDGRWTRDPCDADVTDAVRREYRLPSLAEARQTLEQLGR